MGYFRNAKISKILKKPSKSVMCAWVCAHAPALPSQLKRCSCGFAALWFFTKSTGLDQCNLKLRVCCQTRNKSTPPQLLQRAQTAKLRHPRSHAHHTLNCRSASPALRPSINLSLILLFINLAVFKQVSCCRKVARYGLLEESLSEVSCRDCCPFSSLKNSFLSKRKHHNSIMMKCRRVKRGSRVRPNTFLYTSDASKDVYIGWAYLNKAKSWWK